MRIHLAKFGPDWSNSLAVPTGWTLWVNPVGGTHDVNVAYDVPSIMRIHHAKFGPDRSNRLAMHRGQTDGHTHLYT